MSVQPTSAPAETVSPVDQAQSLLAEAVDAECWTATRPGYRDHGVQAVRDAQAGTGHAVLALSQELAVVRSELTAIRAQSVVQQGALRIELAGVRRELGGIAAAVRELTGAITKTSEPLADAVDQLTQITGVIGKVVDEGLAPIATAVSSLADVVEDRRRRSWRDRLSWWCRQDVGASLEVSG
jgi:hypothetical protein